MTLGLKSVIAITLKSIKACETLTGENRHKNREIHRTGLADYLDVGLYRTTNRKKRHLRSNS